MKKVLLMLRKCQDVCSFDGDDRKMYLGNVKAVISFIVLMVKE